MSYNELSDLEEGEILEYDTNVPSNNYKSENIGIRNNSFEELFKQHNEHLKFVGNKDLNFSKQGYINKKLKEKLKLNDALVAEKTRISLADLESISSEGEYKSDEFDKYSLNEKDYYSNAEKRKREKHSSKFYGAVEDIMSEIGETICRKSRCNYKKRKSKEVIRNLEKCYDSAFDLFRRRLLSSHLKSRKERRKISFCDSDSDFEKDRAKKKKRRRRGYEDEEKVSKKLDLRDFDEVRRNLLEKLKKEKVKEESKTSTVESNFELENSEIQEVDMLIDCTNYVGNPLREVTKNAAEEEKDGEDELDLIQLRRIALASNKRRKNERDTAKTEENCPAVLTEKKPDVCREETDLDRHELLLRAEALKTALIKKHQRRLNKLKVEKPTNAVELTNASIKDADSLPNTNIKNLESLEEVNIQNGCGKLESESCKENLERRSEDVNENGTEVSLVVSPPQSVEIVNMQGTLVTSNVNSKKINQKMKTKRKKRKPVSSANLKENNQTKESLEEDDRTLRTQLLSDLMKKKSLKDLEKKPILVDSVQAAENKPSPPMAKVQPPKETVKPLPAVKRDLPKKLSAAKSGKAAAPVTFPKPEIQRIIVHLGSEDSSDEDVAPPLAPHIFPEQMGSETNPIVNSAETKQQTNDVIRANYEKSVELLLSQTRKKVEGEKRTVAAASLDTPEAVYKHLPPSQRLEYIRLKQKIAERESQKKEQRKEAAVPKAKVGNFPEPVARPPNPHSSVPEPVRNSSTAAKTEPGVASATEKTSPMEKGNIKLKKTNVTKSAVKSSNKYVAAPPTNGAKTAASVGRNLLLLPSSQALMSKLKLLLKKIKIEKMMEENYEKEVSKLKNQLSLFEKRKSEQRFKIKKLWEESMKTYKAIQGITNKSNEKAAPKEKEKERENVPGDPGAKAEGKKNDEEKDQEKQKMQEIVEEENDKKSNEQEVEITHSENSGGDVDDDDKRMEELSGVASGVGLAKYDSPLGAFNKASELSSRVDPNVEVCQFDLLGVCKDEECAYQHLRIEAK